MARSFVIKPAVRERVPLWIGLMGPSGSGKTYSALRLATGIQQATGGDIYGIDTEARRMLHYADMFEFKHMQFDAPFGSIDYLEAIRFCVKQGAKIVVIDSMSHEHEGAGGHLEAQEAELDRLAGDDWAKRERVKFLAWVKPKQDRRELINGLLQLNANFIFCFRAKNTTKPIRNKEGKTEPVAMGYMPIAGDEFKFEQTVNCLLLPNAKGIPTWDSEFRGERDMVKLPEQFKEIFAERKPLDETTGRMLAQWASGGPKAAKGLPPEDSKAAKPAATPSQDMPSTAGTLTPESDALEQYDRELAEAAKSGDMTRLESAWKLIPNKYRANLQGSLNRRHKPECQRIAQEKAGH